MYYFTYNLNNFYSKYLEIHNCTRNNLLLALCISKLKITCKKMRNNLQLI